MTRHPKSIRSRGRWRSPATSCSTGSGTRRPEPGAARGRRGGAPCLPGARAVAILTTRSGSIRRGLRSPVEKMRAGWYTDAYFNHTRATLLEDGPPSAVVMQVFQKNHAYLGGMDEAIAILKLCAEDFGRADRPGALRRRPDRAVRDRAHDRRRLHDVRASRDGLPRRAVATLAHHDQHGQRPSRRERETGDLYAGTSRPPSRPDGRRLRRVRRRPGSRC